MGRVTMEWESRLGRRLRVRDLYILSNLQQELQAAVLGKEDVKKALDNGATYANDQLAKL